MAWVRHRVKMGGPLKEMKRTWKRMFFRFHVKLWENRRSKIVLLLMEDES